MIAVWPSGEIERPRVGGRIEATRGSERRIAVDFVTAPANAGLPTVWVGEWSTTIRALLDWPPKFAWIRSRA